MDQEINAQKTEEPATVENSSSSVCSTLLFWNDEYPVIGKLDRGYRLIGHPNGPAICDGDHLCTLDLYDCDDAVTENRKRRAQRMYREWSWELVKGTLKLPVFS